MKNIVWLIRTDLQKITRNAIAIVVLFGVVVIPSFFGWFNVLSSWNPFGNVKNLKVAVANTDKGFISELFPMPLNVGDQVLSNLRGNSDLNWVFTSQEEAIEGTRSGEYYAALVLPETFSSDMMTFLSPGAEAAHIEYYSNEKTNALSPKITDEAATEVSTKINDTFTKSLNEVGLSTISALAQNLGSPEAQSAVRRLATAANSAVLDLRTAASTLDLLSSLLSSSRALVESANSLTEAAGGAVDDSAGAVGKGLNAVRTLKDVLQVSTDSISSALSETSASYQHLIDRVNQLESSVAQQPAAMSALLSALADDVGTQIEHYSELRSELQTQSENATVPALQQALERAVTDLDEVIERQTRLQDRITRAQESLDQGDAELAVVVDEIRDLASETRGAIEQARVSFEEDLRPKLEQLAGSLDSVSENVGSIAGHLAQATQTLDGGSGTLISTLTEAESTTTALAKDLRLSANQVATLATALHKAAETGDFSEVTELIGSNSAILAGELTDPVGLKQIAVFKVDSFGAQMAPFYTVLGLWVGALLLAVVIRTDVNQELLQNRDPLTKSQEYLGRFGIFALLCLAQSSLAYLGLMGFVGVRPAHPFLLLLAGWVMSLVFALITYTLVLSFGEAGKATAVFLLVVQISAGGGAYPLSVLPVWFQNISPWLPVTHATNAVRSAIAGVYDGDYWISLGLLALFVVPALLIGLVLRLPVLKMNNNLARALESTKLM